MAFPQQIYICYCKGCPNGYMSEFEDAPASWWQKKGMSTPRRCKQCRNWIKSQKDESVQCQKCNCTIRLFARQKIAHHRKKGPFVVPKICYDCEQAEAEGRQVLRSVKAFKPSVPKLIRRSDAQALQLDTYDNHPKGLQIHLGKHIVGHPFNQIGQPRGRGHSVSPTTMVGQGATAYDLYQSCASIAASAGPWVYQYVATGNNNIVKAFYVGPNQLEVNFYEPIGGGLYWLKSSHNNFSVAEANANISTGKWV